MAPSGPTKSDAIIMAVQAEDAALLSHLLSNTKRLSRARGSGLSPFHVAAKLGNVEIGHILIAFVLKGPPVEVPGASLVNSNHEVDGSVEFHDRRHRDGRYESLQYWVECRHKGWTALGIAIRNGNTAFAKLMLSEGQADPTNLIRSEVWPYEAVMHAIHKLNIEVVDAIFSSEVAMSSILKKGPQRAVELVLMHNDDWLNCNIFNILHSASRFSADFSKCVEILCRSLRLIQGWLALEKEMNGNYTRRKPELLPADVKANAQHNCRQFSATDHTQQIAAQNVGLEAHYPFHFAVKNILANDKGYNRLKSAFESASFCVVPSLAAYIALDFELCPLFARSSAYWDELLFQALDAPRNRSFFGRAELVGEARLGTVRFLLDEGCDVSALKDGKTPIYYATMHSAFEWLSVLQLLLDLGADPSERNSCSEALLELPNGTTYYAVRSLLHADANCFPPTLTASNETARTFHVPHSILKSTSNFVRTLL